MDALRAFYSRKLIETRTAIQRMQALEAELKDSLAYLTVCQTCAPETLRSACRSCDDEAHRERARDGLRRRRTDRPNEGFPVHRSGTP